MAKIPGSWSWMWMRLPAIASSKKRERVVICSAWTANVRSWSSFRTMILIQSLL